MDILWRYLYAAGPNLTYLGILVLVFLTVTALVLAGILLTQRRSPLQERLARFLPGRVQAAAAKKSVGLFESAPPSLMVRMTRPLHGVVAPQQGSERKQLRLRLLRAGFRSELAFYNFIAAKIVLMLALPLAFAMIRFFFTLTPDVIIICVLLALLGFFIPDLALWGVANHRQEQIARTLPDALDLMVVCVEAGYGLDMTFKRVGEEMKSLAPELSEEFALTNREIRAGRPREESFKDMAVRTGVSEVHSLMTMLVQTSRFGTSLAKALRVHADAMRIKRRQIAEEQAAKSAVKLVFPLVLFVFPGLLIVLAGPAFIRIYQALLPTLSQ